MNICIPLRNTFYLSFIQGSDGSGGGGSRSPLLHRYLASPIGDAACQSACQGNGRENAGVGRGGPSGQGTVWISKATGLPTPHAGVTGRGSLFRI